MNDNKAVVDTLQRCAEYIRFQIRQVYFNDEEIKLVVELLHIIKELKNE